jgi:putative endonuclease
MFEWFVSRLRNSTTRGRSAHLDTGERGEVAAFFYLRRAGYVVVARDWRSGLVRGDLDLVAWEGDTLCVIEVKTRSSHRIATAESSVDDHKRRTLRHLTRSYLRQLDLKPIVRFDILSIYFEGETAPQFQLIRGAFGWS